MKPLIRSIGILAILLAVFGIVPAALAHPLGNFTINHYSGLLVRRDEIVIDYVLDMAEIPAFQEISALDENGSGGPDEAETAAYHPAQCEAVRSSLSLRADRQPVPIRLEASTVEFPEGQGGLLTLRLSCTFRASLPGAEHNLQVEYQDASYADRLGWREIAVQAEGVSLKGDYATSSLSRRLVEYPDDLLSSPLDQSEVSFEVDLLSAANGAPEPEGAAAADPAARPVAAQAGKENDAFTRLILLEDLTLPSLLLALGISFAWGAMHALTPGHGKTIVGAYLVGSRGTARHALWLGLATTITHTAGVFALGLVTLLASRYILPEMLFPWLSLISGLLVVAIGLNLFWSRLKGAGLDRYRAGKWWRASSYLPDGRRIDYVQRYKPSLLHAHSHTASIVQPGSHHTGHDHHHHDHAHLHQHPHTHSHDAGETHDRSTHSHLPPGADDAPVTWRSLLALGISGGLLPCPSALVVLLSAIALDRVGLGLVLVLFFSLGLAGVLTAIGLAFVYAGRLFDRAPVQSPLVRLLPALSALFITLVGLGISGRAFIELGWIQLIW